MNNHKFVLTASIMSASLLSALAGLSGIFGTSPVLMVTVSLFILACSLLLLMEDRKLQRRLNFEIDRFKSRVEVLITELGEEKSLNSGMVQKLSVLQEEFSELRSSSDQLAASLDNNTDFIVSRKITMTKIVILSPYIPCFWW